MTGWRYGEQAQGPDGSPTPFARPPGHVHLSLATAELLSLVGRNLSCFIAPTLPDKGAPQLAGHADETIEQSPSFAAHVQLPTFANRAVAVVKLLLAMSFLCYMLPVAAMKSCVAVAIGTRKTNIMEIRYSRHKFGKFERGAFTSRRSIDATRLLADSGFGSKTVSRNAAKRNETSPPSWDLTALQRCSPRRKTCFHAHILSAQSLHPTQSVYLSVCVSRVHVPGCTSIDRPSAAANMIEYKSPDCGLQARRTGPSVSTRIRTVLAHPSLASSVLVRYEARKPVQSPSWMRSKASSSATLARTASFARRRETSFIRRSASSVSAAAARATASSFS